jgi:hypothetical protein
MNSLDECALTNIRESFKLSYVIFIIISLFASAFDAFSLLPCSFQGVYVSLKRIYCMMTLSPLASTDSKAIRIIYVTRRRHTDNINADTA